MNHTQVEAAGQRRRTPLQSAPSRSETKLLVVDSQEDRAVEQHPEVVSCRLDGWTIRRAEPRVVEAVGAQLLVVLERETERRPSAH